MTKAPNLTRNQRNQRKILQTTTCKAENFFVFFDFLLFFSLINACFQSIFVQETKEIKEKPCGQPPAKQNIFFVFFDFLLFLRKDCGGSM